MTPSPSPGAPVDVAAPPGVADSVGPGIEKAYPLAFQGDGAPLDGRSSWPPGTATPPRVVRVVLRGGFRGHGVVITIDGHEIYRRSRVTTDAVTLRADAIDVVLSSPLAHVEVSVTPGQLVASVDIAFCDHACLAIDLVGAATVSFETQGGGVPDGAPGTRRARSEAMSHRHPRSEARPSRSEAIDDAVIRRLR